MSLAGIGLAVLIIGVLLLVFTAQQTLGWAAVIIGGVITIAAAVKRM